MPAHLGKINLSTWTILSFTSSLRWPKGTYIETKKFWVWLDMLNYATQLKIFLWVITMCNELEDLYWLPAEILMINESCNLLVQDHFGDTILVTQSETVILHNSQKNTYVRVSFFNKVAGGACITYVFGCKINEIFIFQTIFNLTLILIFNDQPKTFLLCFFMAIAL